MQIRLWVSYWSGIYIGFIEIDDDIIHIHIQYDPKINHMDFEISLADPFCFDHFREIMILNCRSYVFSPGVMKRECADI